MGQQARVQARPRAVSRLAQERGALPLGLGDTGDERDGLLYVPPALPAGLPAPLIVAFHGAGGDAGQVVPLLRSAADASGLLVLAPDSRGSTWDLVRGGFGMDVRFLERALEWTSAATPWTPRG
jgi:phospholipase/carboxylesterase